MTTDPKLDPTSDTWLHVRGWAEREIARLHVENETAGRTLADTENTRGRIAAMRDLLKLHRPPRPDVPAEHGYT